MPPRAPPFPPMEAELVEELPSPDGWQYEPKWDGFRGVLENLGGGLRLWSRNGRPLLRYFPELEEVGALLPPDSALDGEIVIAQKGRLEFDALQLRLHPAESRIRKLSAEIPAEFIAFDLLVWKGEPMHKLPLEKRRRELERKAKRFQLSPASRDRKQADKELDWNPVKPKLVCEVRYDKLERNRFRHGTRFLRFRPDKDPDQCTWGQVKPRRRRGDPTVESLLARA